MSHPQFRHGCAAVRAGIGALVSFAATRQTEPSIPHLNLADVVRWWHIPTAGGAGLLADPGEQDAQVGEHFRDGAHRGSRAVVGQMLVYADRRG